ncbi:MAG: hypothetical protein LBD29_10605 [Treponema sp.]|jgi:hypothetical protein|nr:hypothetical protein [Treponema sp.]
MKKTLFVFLSIGALLAAGCASSNGTSSSSKGNATVPAEITQWRNEHDLMHGLGISTFDDESDAMQQAATIARQNLASLMETEVAGISENYVKRSTVGGESDKAAKFQEGTKQIVSQTLRGAKIYGPYMNNRGSTYVIIYLDDNSKKAFDKNVHDIADEIFAPMEGELNEILGNS